MRNTSSLWTALCLVLLSCQTKVDLDTVIMEGEDTAVCWMTGLADDTPVTSLSIPGAHDAASSTITAFKRWTRTQELNVAELWNCGDGQVPAGALAASGQLASRNDARRSPGEDPCLEPEPV